MVKTNMRPNMGEAIDEIVNVATTSGIDIQKFKNEMSKPQMQKIGSISYKLEPIDPEAVNQGAKKIEKMALAKIGVIIDEYCQAEREFQTLHGEAIMPDAQLLNGFNLNEGDLKALAEKYKDNFTMYRAILNYANAQKITYIRPLQTPEQRTEILDSFWKKCYPRFLEMISILPGTKLVNSVDELKVIMQKFKDMALAQLR